MAGIRAEGSQCTSKTTQMVKRVSVSPAGACVELPRQKWGHDSSERFFEKYIPTVVDDGNCRAGQQPLNDGRTDYSDTVSQRKNARMFQTSHAHPTLEGHFLFPSY